MTIDPLGFAKDRLRELAEGNLLRALHPVTTGPGPVVEIDGERLLNFSSNNYLGLAEHPAVTEAAAEAAHRWGTGATASRLIVGSTELIHGLEEQIAAWRGTEAALVFPTGYQTNLGTVGALVESGDLVVADKLCHASLIDAARLSGATLRTYPHRNLDRLERLLSDRPTDGRALVLADGVYSMDGDLCDLPSLIEVTAHHGALLLVDDAHAVGVFGKTGAGTLEHFGLEAPPHMIQTATLSKAIGSQGGFVCGPRHLIDLLINRARTFIFTTGLSPMAAAAARAALEVIAREPERRERLWSNRERLAAGLDARGWDLLGSASPILPLLMGGADEAIALAEHLHGAGILGVAIRPPTVPRGGARVRLTVMATHTPEQIDALLEALGAAPNSG